MIDWRGLKVGSTYKGKRGANRTIESFAHAALPCDVSYTKEGHAGRTFSCWCASFADWAEEELREPLVQPHIPNVPLELALDDETLEALWAR